jgi:hypothetical protein
MLDGGDAAAEALATLQHLQALLGVRRIERQLTGPVQVGIESDENLDRVVMTTWTHTVKLATPTDKNAGRSP